MLVLWQYTKSLHILVRRGLGKSPDECDNKVFTMGQVNKCLCPIATDLARLFQRMPDVIFNSFAGHHAKDLENKLIFCLVIFINDLF